VSTQTDNGNGNGAGTDPSPATEQPQRPALRIVRGEPTADELAALVAVLSARAAQGDGGAPARARSAWNAPSRLVRKPVAHGRDGWRRSSLPG
jgi:hypothetical protein